VELSPLGELSPTGELSAAADFGSVQASRVSAGLTLRALLPPTPTIPALPIPQVSQAKKTKRGLYV
jgi:hypothetical protein